MTSQEPSQTRLLVSTPNSTAEIAAKAHRSALDLPDSYNEVGRLGDLYGLMKLPIVKVLLTFC